MSLVAYCFREESAADYIAFSPARAFEGAVAPPGLKILEDIGLDALTNGNTLFVTVGKISILAGLENQCSQPPEKIVFLLDNQTTPSDDLVEAIKNLKKKGFRFAIENIKDFDKMDAIAKLCDFILFNFEFNFNNLDLYKKIEKRYRLQTFVATGVNDMVAVERLARAGFTCFEGKFYKLPVQQNVATMAPVKMNRIQLLKTVREDDFSMEEVVKIVSRDPSMSISLLKLVNSLGASQKIKNIQHAIAMLGQVEVRKWVTTAIAALLAEDKPGELTRLSLVRAKFCENMARHFEMMMHADALFLMGLFSVLDATLNLSMEDALQLVPVSPEIHEALVSRTGKLAPVLNFVLDYEAANWAAVKNAKMLLNIPADAAFAAYTDTVSWYDTIISAVVNEEDAE